MDLDKPSLVTVWDRVGLILPTAENTQGPESPRGQDQMHTFNREACPLTCLDSLQAPDSASCLPPGRGCQIPESALKAAVGPCVERGVHFSQCLETSLFGLCLGPPFHEQWSSARARYRKETPCLHISLSAMTLRTAQSKVLRKCSEGGCLLTSRPLVTTSNNRSHFA